MAETKVITGRVNEETLALVDRVAKARGRSRAWFVANAVRQVAEAEAEFIEFVQEGIDAADRGEVISQAEMERWFEDRIAKRAKGIAAE